MGLIDKQTPDQIKIAESSECRLKKDADGIRCCTVHGKPLQQLTTTGDPNSAGLGYFSAWKCIDSGKTIMEVGGF